MARPFANNSGYHVVAEDIMSPVVVSVMDQTLIKDAAHLMLRDRISGVPVLNDKKELRGILTITDLFRVIHETDLETGRQMTSAHKHVRDLTVGEVMTDMVRTIEKQTPLNEIVQIALEQGVHGFPVVQGKEIVGIIGRHDILNAFFNF